MKNFLDQMQRMVRGLQADAGVQVLTWHPFPPATEAEIATVEDAIGKKLPNDLRDFYLKCNGMQLRWINKDNPEYNPAEFGEFVPGPVSFQDFIDDSNRTNGTLNILPIRETFMKTTKDFAVKWDKLALLEGEIVQFGKNAIPYKDLMQKLHPFDLCSENIFVVVEHKFLDNSFLLEGPKCYSSHYVHPSFYFRLIIETKCNLKARFKMTADVPEEREELS